MRKLSKFLALSLVLVSIAATFTGCSSDETKLLEAVIKSQSINSMEAKEVISIQLDASGLSQEDQQKSAAFIQLINNMNITLNEKMVRDADNGLVKVELLSDFTLGGVNSYANIWLDSSVSNGQPQIKEIFQFPPFATMALTKGISGKDYIVLDTASMQGQSPSPVNVPSLNNLTGLNKEIIEKTSQFYLSYAKNLKPGFDIVKSTGANGADGKLQTLYQLKLSDSAFKDYISFLVNDLGKNKENLQLIKDYITSIMEITMSANPEVKIPQEELDKSLSMLESQIPNFVESFNTYWVDVKDTPLLGKDGIIVNYIIDSNGYLVGQSSTIDLIMDLGKISETLSKFPNFPINEAISGKVNLKITTNTEISKINEKVDISLPVTTDDNSIDFESLIGNFSGAEVGSVDDKTDNNLNDKDITVFVNGQIVTFNDAPVVKDDRTLVPAREVLESLGGNLEWDVSSQTVTAKIGTNVVVFTIDSSEATVNGVAKKLDVPAALINSRTYVPLRFLSDSVGGELIWIEEASAAFINTK